MSLTLDEKLRAAVSAITWNSAVIETNQAVMNHVKGIGKEVISDIVIAKQLLKAPLPLGTAAPIVATQLLKKQVEELVPQLTPEKKALIVLIYQNVFRELKSEEAEDQLKLATLVFALQPVCRFNRPKTEAFTAIILEAQRKFEAIPKDNAEEIQTSGMELEALLNRDITLSMSVEEVMVRTAKRLVENSKKEPTSLQFHQDYLAERVKKLAIFRAEQAARLLS